jgi:hypothetical protein
MKGTLSKTENGWLVIYDEAFGENIVKKNQLALPLHPDDMNQIIEDSKIFDNIEARIKIYPEVEFRITKDCPFDFTSRCTMDRCDCKEYAKLINKI